MTESEAKQKWCPMVRLKELNCRFESVGHNRKFDHDDDGRYDEIWKGVNCIGSACMMWRWEPGKRPENEMNPVHGVCGLAGKP